MKQAPRRSGETPCPTTPGTRDGARTCRTPAPLVRAVAATSLACIALTAPVHARAGGPFGIDHRVGHDVSGIWNPAGYRGVLAALSVGQLGLALWEGGDTRLGDTAWRGIDSELLGAVSAEGLKHLFSRERPAETNDPNGFFSGGSHHSFPSGEAAEAASLVTPYILEYGQDDPAIYGLLALPLWVGTGRIKAQAHWQSDVLAGWALGALTGWYAHDRESPLVLSVLPDGFFVGLKTRF